MKTTHEAHYSNHSLLDLLNRFDVPVDGPCADALVDRENGLRGINADLLAALERVALSVTVSEELGGPVEVSPLDREIIKAAIARARQA